MDIKRLFYVFGVVVIMLLFAGFATTIKSDNDIEESSGPITGLAPEPPSDPTPHIENTSIIETTPEETYNFYEIPFDLETQIKIIEICSEYDLSYELILGVISVESSFRAEVIGDGGNSFGLMQIQPRWWRKTMDREGVTDLLDPLQNIRCGCAILRELIDKYGTEYSALQAYNTGKPYTTNGYADKVYRHIKKLTIYGG